MERYMVERTFPEGWHIPVSEDSAQALARRMLSDTGLVENRT